MTNRPNVISTVTASLFRWATLAALAALGAAACASERRVDTAVPARSAVEPDARWPAPTHYRTVVVRGRRLFYREAGDRSRPTVLLLHGFPASSHTYRDLIPLLSGRYHVVAPDDLGSGFSDRPSPADVTYTFDLLADHLTGLVEALELRRYVMYMQDFGAPVGYRVAVRHPERLRALVVQNANAYLDGLTEQRRAFFRRAHDDRSESGVAALTALTSPESVRLGQYLRDVPGERAERMSPDTWRHDLAGLVTPEHRAVQVQLFQDYQSNIDAYPEWQAFLRRHQPPTLIVWGERDPAFISDGARAYLRDVPNAELHLLDAGHFALEERPVEIAQHMVRFIEQLPP